jgi:molecular chaperone GrpE (heat shock protein)
MQAIVIEAATRVETGPQKSGVRIPGKEGASETPPAWVRPILEGLDALNRAHNENALRLTRIEKHVGVTGGVNEQVAQLLAESRTTLEQRNGVSRVMFEALHGELKAYKDAFILEAVLRPVIRDLITLYDDMTEIHRQMNASIAAQEARGGVTGPGVLLLENVQVMSSNIEHNIHFILEVLERMEVTLLEENLGKLDRRTQRAIAVETAETPDQDQSVIRIVKRGFTSRHRVVRPEEVVIQKWKDGCLEVIPAPSTTQPPRPT